MGCLLADSSWSNSAKQFMYAYIITFGATAVPSDTQTMLQLFTNGVSPRPLQKVHTIRKSSTRKIHGNSKPVRRKQYPEVTRSPQSNSRYGSTHTLCWLPGNAYISVLVVGVSVPSTNDHAARGQRASLKYCYNTEELTPQNPWQQTASQSSLGRCDIGIEMKGVTFLKWPRLQTCVGIVTRPLSELFSAQHLLLELSKTKHMKHKKGQYRQNECQTLL